MSSDHAAGQPSDAQRPNILRRHIGGDATKTLDEAIALERSGDREALRDHVRSFGCKTVWPRKAFKLFESAAGRVRAA